MVYNDMDQRAEVLTGTSMRVFVYDEADRLIGGYGSSIKTVYAEHVWLTPDPDEAEGWQPLALVGPTTTTWVTGDHLGTPAYLTTSTGAVANSYEATPWGGRWKSLVSSPTTALGQPGQIEDDVTYRAYNLHRDYDPSLGRYIEADPIGLAGGENGYGYVGGNPVGLIDPEGKGPAGAAFGGWFGGAAAGALGIESGPLDVLAVAAGRYGGRIAGSAVEDYVFAQARMSPEQKQAYKAYKAIQYEPRSKTGDPCKDDQNELDRAQRELNAREDFSRKYHNCNPDPGHAEYNQNLRNYIQKLKSRLTGCPPQNPIP